MTSVVSLAALSPSSRPPGDDPIFRSRRSPPPYLPIEILQEILRYLSPQDYDSARFVCRQWFEASLSRVLLEGYVHQLNRMNIRSVSVSCPNSCPCKDRFELYQLRKMFSSMVME